MPRPWKDMRSSTEREADERYARARSGDAAAREGRAPETSHRESETDITKAIANAADRIVAYREGIKEGRKMPLEIKGLKAGALMMRTNIERLQTAYAKFNEMAPQHAGDVEGITKQVADQQSDLEFAVGVIKNSTEQGGEQQG